MWRPLTNAEISQLIQQNNSADDWTQISVACAFSVLNIHNCHFHGEVKIEDNVMMSNVLHIANYHIGANAKLSNIGQLMFTTERFAYPLELCNEDGRYTVTAVPDMNTTDVFTVLHIGKPDLYADIQPESMGFVGQNVTIENVTAIRNTHINGFAKLSGCCEIEQTYISSSKEEPASLGAGVIVRRAISTPAPTSQMFLSGNRSASRKGHVSISLQWVTIATLRAAKSATHYSTPATSNTTATRS
jgi:hypothetical protein